MSHYTAPAVGKSRAEILQGTALPRSHFHVVPMSPAQGTAGVTWQNACRKRASRLRTTTKRNTRGSMIMGSHKLKSFHRTGVQTGPKPCGNQTERRREHPEPGHSCHPGIPSVRNPGRSCRTTITTFLLAECTDTSFTSE